MAGQKNELTPEQKAAQEAEEQARQEAGQRAQANAKETVVVTFVKPYSRYSRGDVAGFAAAEAERLVKGRVAVKGSKLPAKKPEQDSEPKA
jgi:hypothetical protein